MAIVSIKNKTKSGSLLVGNAGFEPTYALFAGGYRTTYTNKIESVNIPTISNATVFGDLTVSRFYAMGTSSTTRGIFGGGHESSNVIDYVTIATTGNATDFGDLTNGRNGGAAVSNYHGGI